MRLVLPFLLLLAGCPSPEDRLSCEASARKDAHGNPDPCEVDACLACEAACDESCVSLEELRPNYRCEGQVWTPEDVCPGWEWGGQDPDGR